MTDGTHRHDHEELCEAGLELYSGALREGHVHSSAAATAPCLIDSGLPHPAVHDLDRLEPTAPAVALQRLLRTPEERIARERRRGESLADVFEPLMRLGTPATAGENPPAPRILSGKERTGRAITDR